FAERFLGVLHVAFRRVEPSEQLALRLVVLLDLLELLTKLALALGEAPHLVLIARGQPHLLGQPLPQVARVPIELGLLLAHLSHRLARLPTLLVARLTASALALALADAELEDRLVERLASVASLLLAAGGIAGRELTAGLRQRLDRAPER